MNIIGLIVFIIMVILGHKPKKFHNSIYFETGTHWGGITLGFVIIVNKNVTSVLLKHEYGHVIQNAMYGILFPFIIAIPSIIRSWYRGTLFKINKQKYFNLPPYDSIWFEGQATKLGKKYS